MKWKSLIALLLACNFSLSALAEHDMAELAKELGVDFIGLDLPIVENGIVQYKHVIVKFPGERKPRKIGLVRLMRSDEVKAADDEIKRDISKLILNEMNSLQTRLSTENLPLSDLFAGPFEDHLDAANNYHEFRDQILPIVADAVFVAEDVMRNSGLSVRVSIITDKSYRGPLVAPAVAMYELSIAYPFPTEKEDVAVLPVESNDNREQITRRILDKISGLIVSHYYEALPHFVGGNLGIKATIIKLKNDIPGLLPKELRFRDLSNKFFSPLYSNLRRPQKSQIKQIFEKMDDRISPADLILLLSDLEENLQGKRKNPIELSRLIDAIDLFRVVGTHFNSCSHSLLQ